MSAALVDEVLACCSLISESANDGSSSSPPSKKKHFFINICTHNVLAGSCVSEIWESNFCGGGFNVVGTALMLYQVPALSASVCA